MSHDNFLLKRSNKDPGGSLRFDRQAL
ncbi:hypothetical protein [Scandinavium sp. UTDF21-P1B]